jgi:hypothetical protein
VLLTALEVTSEPLLRLHAIVAGTTQRDAPGSKEPSPAVLIRTNIQISTLPAPGWARFDERSPPFADVHGDRPSRYDPKIVTAKIGGEQWRDLHFFGEVDLNGEPLEK